MVAVRVLESGRPGPPEELDAATLSRCRSGDPVAFRAFVVRYQAAVFALLARVLGPRLSGRGETLEDLAQETFLKAHRGLAHFDTSKSTRPSTWLLTIATRVALDGLKKRRLPSEPLESASAVPSLDSPERSAARHRLGQAIEAAAAQLSDEQRTVFVLSQFHDFSLEEIAASVGVAPATVKTRLFRARLRLRELLVAERSEELLP
jgi:RNA polymerase sigma-70 factor (ECF subfamily)